MKLRIYGTPYGKFKVRGDIRAPIRWTRAVIEQTSEAEPVTGPCELAVTFYLPENKFPADLPFGPDLDNLLKRLFDGLNETLFRLVPGHDSCVVRLSASKLQVLQPADAGAEIEINLMPI
jgi:Holliday junction resolvase RusA-like endonuclease